MPPGSVPGSGRAFPGVAGFFGASSMERLPTKTAITERASDFESIAVR